jgi:diguanylate cyclase (GGDEF)-like protein
MRLQPLPWIAWSLLAFATAPGAALDRTVAISQYAERTWREELPQATVNTVRQTRDGYLWLGTYEGLVRWNGLSFQTFDRDNTPALRLSAIWTLLEDRAGTLWVGTLGAGLVRYDGRSFAADGPLRELANDSVFALVEAAPGSLWIGTGRGLFRMTPSGLWNVPLPAGLPSSVVRSLVPTSDGALWVGTEAAGLLRFDQGTWRRYGAAEGLAHPGVTSLAASPEGDLWVGTLGGLQRFDGTRFETFGTESGLQNLRVWALRFDRDPQAGTQDLWVGTEGGGLHRFRDRRFEALRAPRLPSDIVRALEIDREGSLWVGSNGGLTQLRAGTFSGFGTADGLDAEQVRVAFEDHRGQLWVGSDGGGLARRSGGRFVRFPLPRGTGTDLVRAIAEQADGTLWVGTAGAGLFTIGRERRPRARSFGEAAGLPNLFVRSILAARDGAIWVGTNGGLAVSRSDAAPARGRAFEPFPGLPPTGRVVTGLIERRDGAIVAATSGGGVFEIRGREVRRWSGEQGLPAESVLALHEAANGDLWIGTQAGLARLRGDRIESFGRTAGIPEQAYFAILEDGDGALWLSSNTGVLRVDRRVLAGERDGVGVRRFGLADGMPSRQCNGGSQPAAIRARDGRFWFATTRGVASVDPARVSRNEVAPPVVVESVSIDGVIQELDPAVPLQLPPGTQRLEIDFAALSYTDPARIHYRFRLLGFEDGWREALGRHQVEYTRLAPRSYSFQVQAANEDGVWNETGARVEFVQAAFLHQRPGFWGSLALAVVASATLGVRGRLALLKARQRDLERAVDDKTQALSEQMTRVNDVNARLEEANQKLETLALIDPLTDLANRRRFEDTLAAEWSRARRTRAPLALALFDVDAFKAFNDTFGHPEGDRCLKSVAGVLAAGLRRGDLAARWGGEEFALLLPGARLADAVEIATELSARIEALAIPHRSPPAPADHVTISAGVASLEPSHEQEAQEILLAADGALYEAKRSGRRRVVAARPVAG